MRYLKSAALVALAFVIPGGLIVGAAVVLYRRVRERNRVTMVQVATPRVQVTAFVPAKQWWGRA